MDISEIDKSIDNSLEFSYRERKGLYFIGYKKNDDEFYGEVVLINLNKEILGKYFVINSFLFGVVDRYEGGKNINKEFYSLYEPGKRISDFEYRKELFKIRMLEGEEPECLRWYNKTLPANWLELFNKKLLEDSVDNGDSFYNKNIRGMQNTLTIKFGEKNK